MASIASMSRGARRRPNFQEEVVRIGHFLAGLGQFVGGIGVLKIARPATGQG